MEIIQLRKKDVVIIEPPNNLDSVGKMCLINELRDKFEKFLVVERGAKITIIQVEDE